MDISFREYGEAGLRIRILPLSKFKTTSVVVNVLSALREETVTLNALLPAVLQRGTRRLPTVKDLQDRLDDLYGATLDSTMFKLGERQVAQFELEVPNEKFLPGAPPLLEQGIALLAEVLRDPAREGDRLRVSSVEMEKEALRKRLEGIINNKGRYAMIRCIEEMCASEPYRLLSFGRLEDLAGIDAERLSDYYSRWLQRCRMDVFVVGDVEPAVVAGQLLQALAGLAGDPEEIPPTRVGARGGTPREVIDRFDVQQGQLVLGYRTPVLYPSEQYPAFLVFNGVLGGYAHSKLFMNVREKESLAYSAFSRYEAHKGLFLIQAGINLGDFAKARDLVFAQVEAVASGEVSDLELEQTRAMLANDFLEMADDPTQLAHHAYVDAIEGVDRPVSRMLQAIARVTVADLQAMARSLALETVYFLRDRAPAEVPHA